METWKHSSYIPVFTVLALATVFLAGCNSLTGTYTVVDMDKTLAGIHQVPKGFEDTSLEKYKERIAKQYAGKALDITKQEPHSFLFPVNLEGSVDGIIYGGWRHGKPEGSILIFQWLSGSVYDLWGKGTYDDGRLTVRLTRFNDAVILHLKKERWPWSEGIGKPKLLKHDWRDSGRAAFALKTSTAHSIKDHFLKRVRDARLATHEKKLD